MFKDCKSGGYNLQSTPASGQRLIALMLLIAIAYTCATCVGHQLKPKAVQNYIGRLKALRRLHQRHSSFWIGLYGQLWIGAMEFCSDLADDLIRLKSAKLPDFRRGLPAMQLIQSAL
jgi:hypothetical protein